MSQRELKSLLGGKEIPKIVEGDTTVVLRTRTYERDFNENGERRRSRSSVTPQRSVQPTRSRSSVTPQRSVQPTRSRSSVTPQKSVQPTRSRSSVTPQKSVQPTRSRSSVTPQRSVQPTRSQPSKKTPTKSATNYIASYIASATSALAPTLSNVEDTNVASTSTRESRKRQRTPIPIGANDENISQRTPSKITKYEEKTPTGRARRSRTPQKTPTRRSTRSRTPQRTPTIRSTTPGTEEEPAKKKRGRSFKNPPTEPSTSGPRIQPSSLIKTPVTSRRQRSITPVAAGRGIGSITPSVGATVEADTEKKRRGRPTKKIFTPVKEASSVFEVNDIKQVPILEPLVGPRTRSKSPAPKRASKTPERIAVPPPARRRRSVTPDNKRTPQKQNTIDTETIQSEPEKRKRGRPAKKNTTEDGDELPSTSAKSPAPKSRSTAPKATATETNVNDITLSEQAPKKRRGRPPKNRDQSDVDNKNICIEQQQVTTNLQPSTADELDDDFVHNFKSHEVEGMEITDTAISQDHDKNKTDDEKIEQATPTESDDDEEIKTSTDEGIATTNKIAQEYEKKVELGIEDGKAVISLNDEIESLQDIKEVQTPMESDDDEEIKTSTDELIATTNNIAQEYEKKVELGIEDDKTVISLNDEIDSLQNIKEVQTPMESDDDEEIKTSTDEVIATTNPIAQEYEKKVELGIEDDKTVISLNDEIESLQDIKEVRTPMESDDDEEIKTSTDELIATTNNIAQEYEKKVELGIEDDKTVISLNDEIESLQDIKEVRTPMESDDDEEIKTSTESIPPIVQSFSESTTVPMDEKLFQTYTSTKPIIISDLKLDDYFTKHPILQPTTEINPIPEDDIKSSKLEEDMRKETKDIELRFEQQLEQSVTNKEEDEEKELSMKSERTLNGYEIDSSMSVFGSTIMDSYFESSQMETTISNNEDINETIASPSPTQVEDTMSSMVAYEIEILSREVLSDECSDYDHKHTLSSDEDSDVSKYAKPISEHEVEIPPVQPVREVLQDSELIEEIDNTSSDDETSHSTIGRPTAEIDANIIKSRVVGKSSSLELQNEYGLSGTDYEEIDSTDSSDGETSTLISCSPTAEIVVNIIDQHFPQERGMLYSKESPLDYDEMETLSSDDEAPTPTAEMAVNNIDQQDPQERGKLLNTELPVDISLTRKDYEEMESLSTEASTEIDLNNMGHQVLEEKRILFGKELPVGDSKLETFSSGDESPTPILEINVNASDLKDLHEDEMPSTTESITETGPCGGGHEEMEAYLSYDEYSTPMTCSPSPKDDLNIVPSEVEPMPSSKQILLAYDADMETSTDEEASTPREYEYMDISSSDEEEEVPVPRYLTPSPKPELELSRSIEYHVDLISSSIPSEPFVSSSSDTDSSPPYLSPRLKKNLDTSVDSFDDHELEYYPSIYYQIHPVAEQVNIRKLDIIKAYRNISETDGILEESILSYIEVSPISKATVKKMETCDALNEMQKEAVDLICQTHEKILYNDHRAGFVLGDGSGVGKGRIIAATIYRNFQSGRQLSLWISAWRHQSLNAQRDFSDINATCVKVIDLDKFKNTTGQINSGVIFYTYEELADKTNIKQLMEFITENFNGVLVFDDCHRIVTQEMLDAVNLLQQDRSQARVLYSSALATANLTKISFMERLGLWGSKSSYADFKDFADTIQDQNISANRLVVMDMKAQGSYLERMFSMKDVKFRIEEIPLSAPFQDLYDSAVAIWTILKESMKWAFWSLDYDEHTINSKLKSYWMSHDLFFKTLRASQKALHVVKLTNDAIDRGMSVVIGLQSAEEWDNTYYQDNDFHQSNTFLPTSEMILHKYIVENFPTVIETNSSNSSNRGFEAKRMEMFDGLLERVGLLGKRLPPNCLDLMVFKLGGNTKVAECTERTLGKLSTEAAAFMNDDKRIAIVSAEAIDGLSLHCPKDAINPRCRLHIMMELPWSVDEAVKQLGITHRLNQQLLPQFILCTSDLAVERCLAEAIADRIENLQAQRQDEQQPLGRNRQLSQFNIDSTITYLALQGAFQEIASHFGPINPPPPVQYTGKFYIDSCEFLVNIEMMYKAKKGVHTVFKLNVKTIDLTDFLNRIYGCRVKLQNALFKFFEQMLLKTIHRESPEPPEKNSKNEFLVPFVNEKNFVMRNSMGRTMNTFYTIQLKKRFGFQDMVMKFKQKARQEYEGFYVLRRYVYHQNPLIFCLRVNPTIEHQHPSKVELQIYHPELGMQNKANLESILKEYDKIDMNYAEKYWQNVVSEAVHTFYVLGGPLLGSWKRYEEIFKGHREKMEMIHFQPNDNKPIIGLIMPAVVYKEVYNDLKTTTNRAANSKDN